MRLLQIPSDVLRKIAAHLDMESLTSLTLSHDRVREELRPQLEVCKVTQITRSLLRYLDANGSLVKYLDLSNCNGTREDIRAVIMKCPRLGELNLVNSNFGSLDSLSPLEKLDTLSMTALQRTYFVLPNDFNSTRARWGSVMLCTIHEERSSEQPHYEILMSSSMTFVRKIYIETSFSKKPMVFTMLFLNMCYNVQEIHINIYGSERTDAHYDDLPTLAVQQWYSIQTVVVTRHLSKKGSARGIMKALFAHRSTPEIRRWIDEDRECYIFEHGQFNGTSSPNITMSKEVKLLKHYHQVKLPADGNFLGNLTSPWGPPRSLRVAGPLGRIPSSLDRGGLPTLTELDITACHDDFSGKFRVDLLMSIPTLEVLACSLCFFAFIGDKFHATKTDSLAHIRRALQNLKLRKLFVRGSCHKVRCTPSSCSCGDERECPSCTSEVPLTSSDLVNLSELGHLENLTIRDAHLAITAFKNLGNPKLRCLKLCLNSTISNDGLLGLIQKSRELRYIKLEARELDLESESLWVSLSYARNLKQLCLRTGVSHDAYPMLSNRFHACFTAVVEQLEFLHLHCSVRIYDIFEEGYYGRKIHWFEPAPQDERARFHPGSIGRNLCFAESAVGLVPPLEWDLD